MAHLFYFFRASIFAKTFPTTPSQIMLFYPSLTQINLLTKK